MPAKQPKKGKGKKVTVIPDPTSAPANPEVQAVLDAHIGNVGSEHFPAGYFPIPYTLTPPGAESFPQLPPLRQPLEAAKSGLGAPTRELARVNLRLGAPTCEFARAQAREANFVTFLPCRSVFSTRGA